MRSFQFVCLALLGLVNAGALSATPGAPGAPTLRIQPAEQRAGAASSPMLAVARAGRRLVAVGERGTVLLSDDDGGSFRQARSVPIASTLTSVSFVDAQLGWAVGHWGAVLHTRDGGETWTLQRSDLTRDQPLLALQMLDARRGVAVGLWSIILVTVDGGASWTEVAPPAVPGLRKADLNLYSLFSGAQGALYATAEQGRVLHSNDGGQRWQVLDTGYRGSLWAGIALADGALLVGGLRGTLLRSTDQGATWQPTALPAKSSITGLALGPDGRLLASALDGVLFESRDGQAFQSRQAPERPAYSALIFDAAGRPLLMSDSGPRRPGP